MNKNLTTSTDLLYDLLADPDKIKPQAIAKEIVNIDTDDDDSFMVDHNNDRMSINNVNHNKHNNDNHNKHNNDFNLSQTSDSHKLNKIKIPKRDSENMNKLSPIKISQIKELNLDMNNLTSSDENIKQISHKIANSPNSPNSPNKPNSPNGINDKSPAIGIGNYTTRLSSRQRELRTKISNDLNIDMNNFSLNDRVPNDKPILNLDNQKDRSISIKKSPKNESPKPIPQPIPQPVKMTIADEKKLKFRKMECLAKLMHLKQTGIILSKTYNIESDIEDMEAELKYHTDIEVKKNGIELAKSFLCNGITLFEMANEKYDPFGFKLKGWSNKVKMNKDDYDSVLGELMDKYKSSEGSQMEPELKLFIMIVMSAGSVCISNSVTENLPGLDDVIKNNPQLMAKLQTNINKSISGPSELDKKKELYQNLKKLKESKQQTQAKPTQQTQPIQKVQQVQHTKQSKPTSVKNLLQDIKKSLPLDSIVDNSVTIGDTIDTESDTSKKKPVISGAIRTKKIIKN
jgi:hypothetical protein